MEKVYRIQLRLSTAATISPLFAAVQGDKETRKIQATILTDEGTTFEPGTGVTAEYWSRKPDGTGTQHSSGVTMSGNVVTVILQEQDLAAPGMVYAAIVLKKSGETMAAMPFWFKVMPIPTGEDIRSSNVYEILEAAAHAPVIRSSDLHWMVWSMDTGGYVDTGVPASGVDGSVLYSAEQSLTAAQEAQARSNIDAASDTDLRAGTYETRDLHLGFYLDNQGYLCQG